MDSSSQIVWGLLFGAVGFALFLYGKKQRAIVPLVVGIALCVYPYFVSNTYLLVAVGLLLVAIPYFIRL